MPLYLLEACGLVDKTPPAFSKAIEDGTDVAPLVLQQTLALFAHHDVKLLAYNEQTSGPETEQVLAAAKSAGIAVVPVTETLPARKHYLGLDDGQHRCRRRGGRSEMTDPVLSLRSATLSFGDRELWRNLTLEVAPGEFLAVLGPNGTGKTSLLKTILGQQRLTSGSIEFLGQPIGTGSRRIGYIPQQKLIEQGTPLRARDLVAFGVNGNRWGLPVNSRSVRRRGG